MNLFILFSWFVSYGLTLTGTEDAKVPHSYGVDTYALLQSYGVDAAMHTYEGLIHTIDAAVEADFKQWVRTVLP